MFRLLFTNGAMLAGLAALAIPVVIHLLLRRRRQRLRFSTLRFFERQDEQSSQRRKLRNLLLLTIRLLLLTILVLAFARPFLPRGASADADRQPRQIVFVKEIPKGPTGKIQRIGLAEKLKAGLEQAQGRMEASPSGPRNPLETELLSIWQKVLDKPAIGTQDDFLDLGGESIQAARILQQVNERFGTDLQIGDIFTASTVTRMAELLQDNKDQAA